MNFWWFQQTSNFYSDKILIAVLTMALFSFRQAELFFLGARCLISNKNCLQWMESNDLREQGFPLVVLHCFQNQHNVIPCILQDKGQTLKVECYWGIPILIVVIIEVSYVGDITSVVTVDKLIDIIVFALTLLWWFSMKFSWKMKNIFFDSVIFSNDDVFMTNWITTIDIDIDNN